MQMYITNMCISLYVTYEKAESIKTQTQHMYVHVHTYMHSSCIHVCFSTPNVAALVSRYT